MLGTPTGKSLRPCRRPRSSGTRTKYRLLPPLDAETYAGLKANIAVNGVQVPDRQGREGPHPGRLRQGEDRQGVGLRVPLGHGEGAQPSRRSEVQVRALNLARRHLDYAAKRQIIADEIEGESRSVEPLDRQVAGGGSQAGRQGADADGCDLGHCPRRTIGSVRMAGIARRRETTA